MATEHIIEKRVNTYREIPVEKIVEREVMVERVVERPRYVDRVVEVQVERVVENIITVERVVEKEVVVDTVLEREVEYIVERDVFVNVEHVVEVEIEILVPCARLNEHTTEEFYNVETDVCEFNLDTYTHEESGECEDPQLAREIQARKHEMQSQKNENYQLKAQFDRLFRELDQLRDSGASIEENENVRLRARLNDLSSAFRSLDQQHSMLHKKSVTRSRVTETVVNCDPRVETLRSRLGTLIGENNALVGNINATGEEVRSLIEANSRARDTIGGAFTERRSAVRPY